MSAVILFTAAFVSGQLLPSKPVKQTKTVTKAKTTTPAKTTPSGKATAKAKSAAPAKAGSLKIIKEGVGIEGIAVGKSTSGDVVKKFGKVYRWEVNKKYSNQMTYDNAGVSFYFCQNDKREEIFLIEIKSPFNGKTSRGVTLGKSTLEDTQKIYGKPTEGTQYKGIHFYYNRYGKRNLISEIDIVENTGLRQCDAKK